MSRKKAREIAVHILFQQSFTKENVVDELIANYLNTDVRTMIASDVPMYGEDLGRQQVAYIQTVVRGVTENIPALDKQISQNLHGWNISRLSRMTMALLRLAIYEMEHVEDVPTGVAINEAIEFAKQYESEETGAFVNGILGAITRGDNAEAIAKAEAEEAARLLAEQEAQAQAEAELQAILSAEVGEIADMETAQAAEMLDSILKPAQSVQEVQEVQDVQVEAPEAETAPSEESALSFALDDDEEVELAPVME